MPTRTENVTGQPAPSAPAPTPAPRRRLHLAAIRLVAVAVLFAGWIGYLIYLVVTLPHTDRGEPLILSRPQFLVSGLDVIARVESTGPDAKVTVEKVLYPKEGAPVEPGQEIYVTNLAQCKRLPREGEKEKPEDVPPDWTGPGSYLLALRPFRNMYEVVPTPPSPGYPPNGGRAGPPRLYPATPAALAEYRTIQKP